MLTLFCINGAADPVPIVRDDKAESSAAAMRDDKAKDESTTNVKMRDPEDDEPLHVSS
jgi:hypothetical protein